MKNMIASDNYKNMGVFAFETEGTYEITACVNGRIVNRFVTSDKAEAQEIFSNTAYAMYAR